jgi:hypothetical protein
MVSFSIRDGLQGFLKTLGVAVITSLIIIGILIAASGRLNRDETEREKELIQLQSQTLNTTLAQACVLALPVSAEKGRPPRLVELCFTQYGIEAPNVLHAEGG